jgi:nucleotide-binding universal stress UspA family protein/predicted transcriptional regulator
MAFPYRKILCPIDFHDSSLNALDTAAQIARQNDGVVFVLHVVPMIIQPTAMPVFVDMYKGQQEVAQAALNEIAQKHLTRVKYELLSPMGEPLPTVLKAERDTCADLVVLATHGRRGFSHFFLGSVAELVVRESTCPVLIVRLKAENKDCVGSWMTVDPIAAATEEKLSAVYDRMLDRGFFCLPVVRDGIVLGVINDRDILIHSGHLDHTEVAKAMSKPLVTVSPSTMIREATHLLRKHQLRALPVVDNGKLAGIITTTDLLNALTTDE